LIPEEIKRSLAEHREQSEFELSFATTTDLGAKRFAYASLELIRTDLEKAKPNRDIDYGPLQLHRSHPKWEVAEKLLDQLYGGQQLEFEPLTQFSPFNIPNPLVQAISSKAVYRNNRIWPIFLGELYCTNPTRASHIQRIMTKPNLPLYPASSEAIGEFFGLLQGQNYFFNDYGKLVVVIPDYRARISEFRIGYEQLILEAVSGSVKAESLRCKVFASNQSNSTSSEDLKLTEGRAKFSLGFDPTKVVAALTDARDGSIIDSRDWSQGFINPDYAKVERPSQQIRDMIVAGEGKRIEFKGSLDNPSKDEFLETVIAFSNSEGGLILLGINDNRVPVGYKGDKENIIKMIRDTCEPIIEPSFKDYELDGFPILAIEIPSGQDRPYVLKYRGVIYVRIGSNDVPASRLDIDQLIQNRNVPYGKVGGLV